MINLISHLFYKNKRGSVVLGGLFVVSILFSIIYLDKAKDVIMGCYWYAQTLLEPKGEEPLLSSPGFIDKTYPSGALRIVILDKDNGRSAANINLANIRLNNIEGYRSVVESYKRQMGTVFVYKTQSNQIESVFWINGQLLNVELIRKGYASPRINPETDVVSQAFANYYFTRAFGTDE